MYAFTHGTHHTAVHTYLFARARVGAFRVSVATEVHFHFFRAPTFYRILRSHQGGALFNAVVVAELDCAATETEQRSRHDSFTDEEPPKRKATDDTGAIRKKVYGGPTDRSNPFRKLNPRH